MKIPSGISILLALILSTPVIVTADVLRVTFNGTGDYATIQDAVDTAAPGDVILLGAGTFTGTGNKNIDTKGLAITITSVKGAEFTIIDCEGDGRAFYIHSGETHSTIISNVSIINGDAAPVGEYGGAICCDGSSPVIKDCIFKWNQGFWARAIYLNQSGARIVRNRFIEHNLGMWEQITDHGAVNCVDSNIELIDNYFHENIVLVGSGEDGPRGDCIEAWGSTVTIAGNKFTGNGSTMSFGAVLADSCDVLITGNYFYDNYGETSATVGLGNNSTGTIRANWLQSNDVNCLGAGFHCWDGFVTIDFNLLADNGGSGISLSRSTGTAVILRNVITGAKSVCFDCGKGIRLRECPDVVIERNTLYENGDPECGDKAEIYYYDSTPTIDFNILFNTDSYPMVACGSSTSGRQNSPTTEVEIAQTLNLFWDNADAWIGSYSTGCIDQGIFADPLLCDPVQGNFFHQTGSSYSYFGALPAGCGTSDVLDVTVPPDAVVSSAVAGDVYVLSGFSVTNTSDQEAPVYYRLLFDGDARPDDQGDPYAFVGVSPVLAPGASYTPPEAALIVPNVQGTSVTTIQYLTAYAPALNMPDTATTTITFDLPTPVIAEIPSELVLNQNVPNPFNPATSISFALPQASYVKLSIYNVEGKLVKTLVDETVSAGPHTVDWNGRDDTGSIQSSGIYFYRLRVGDRSMTRKMLLMK